MSEANDPTSPTEIAKASLGLFLILVVALTLLI